jgi:hypothetical protein
VKRWLLGFLLLGLMGCGGSEANTNTFQVETEPSVSDVTLRFTSLPDGVDSVRLSGFAEPAEEHDHAHRIQALESEEEEHEDHEHVLVFGPETRPAAPELTFSGIPSNVIELEIELLAGEEERGHVHVAVELNPGGNYILEDPPFDEAD